MFVHVLAYIYIQGNDGSWYSTSDASTARQLKPAEEYADSWLKYLSKFTSKPIASPKYEPSLSDRVFFEEISSAFGTGAAVSPILVV